MKSYSQYSKNKLRSWIGDELLPQVGHLGVHQWGDWDISRQTGATVMQTLHQFVMIKIMLSVKAKLTGSSQCTSLLSPMIASVVVTERTRSPIQVAEASELPLKVGWPFPYTQGEEFSRERRAPQHWSQQWWSGIWLGYLLCEVFQACPTSKRPHGRPRNPLVLHQISRRR